MVSPIPMRILPGTRYRYQTLLYDLMSPLFASAMIPWPDPETADWLGFGKGFRRDRRKLATWDIYDCKVRLYNIPISPSNLVQGQFKFTPIDNSSVKRCTFWLAERHNRTDIWNRPVNKTKTSGPIIDHRLDLMIQCEALRFSLTPVEKIFVGRRRFESQPVSKKRQQRLWIIAPELIRWFKGHARTIALSMSLEN